MELKDYKLTLEQSVTAEKVRMTVQATSYQSANALAEFMASRMPTTKAYSSKQEREVYADWFSYVDEVNNAEQ